jgi:hypothetical protein
MKLLKELNQLDTNKEFVELLEDMGTIRDLGIGKMINVFKQDFRKYANREGSLTTSSVGKKFNRDWKVGKNSKVTKMGTLTTAGALRNAWKNYDYSSAKRPVPAAAVIYLRHKPAVIIVGTDMNQLNDVVGISWDFDQAPNQDKVSDTLDALPLNDELRSEVKEKDRWVNTDDNTRVRVQGATKVDIAKQSRHTIEKDGETHHYEGVAVTVKDMMEFLRRLIRNFGSSSLVWKLVYSDNKRMTPKDAEDAAKAEAEPEAEENEEEEYDPKKSGPVEAHGVKGMKNTPWRKTFKNDYEMNKWAEANDAEIRGTRKPEGYAKP